MGRSLAVLLLWSGLARGSAAEGDASPEEGARRATNPLALTNSIQVQPAYINVHAGGNDTQLLVRLVLRYPYLLIPGLKVSDFYSLARLEMYSEVANTPNQPAVAGLQDWNAFLLGVKEFGWGAVAGGIDAVLPTATNPALGTQELQIGPAAAFMVLRVPQMQMGALLQTFFAITGATSIGYIDVQPIIVGHLPKAFFLKSDGIMKFDFVRSPRATIPVNLHFGHAFTSRLSLSEITEVVVVGSGQGNVTLELNLNYLGW